MIKIAVDGMGGDFAPEPIVKGSLLALEKFSNLEIVIFGDIDKMKPFLIKNERLQVVDTKEYVDMGVKDPVTEYRKNKDASLFMAMRYVAEGNASAVVTAGPTQAVVVGGHFALKRMPNMKRVAIIPIIPSLDGKGKLLLDSGANVDLKPEHLLDFAIYASVVAKEVLLRNEPKVALLNIGAEEGKGRELDKEAYELLKQEKSINFVGNLEPKEIFLTDADVLLSDGFTGNMVMKTMEGTAIGLGKILEREIKGSTRSKIGYVFMKKALKNFKKALDAKEIGGALVAGLNHTLIKAHGSSNDYAFYNAIRQAKMMVENDVINKVNEILK